MDFTKLSKQAKCYLVEEVLQCQQATTPRELTLYEMDYVLWLTQVEKIYFHETHKLLPNADYTLYFDQKLSTTNTVRQLLY